MASARATSYDLSVNQRPQIALSHVGIEREPVLLIDNLLNDPAAMVETRPGKWRSCPRAIPMAAIPASARRRRANMWRRWCGP